MNLLFIPPCSDKIPRGDRLYVLAKDAAAAAEGRGPPVSGRGELPPGERSNAWTVALTPDGVVDYLNRKTSPLGEASSTTCTETCERGSFLLLMPNSGAEYLDNKT